MAKSKAVAKAGKKANAAGEKMAVAKTKTGKKAKAAGEKMAVAETKVGEEANAVAKAGGRDEQPAVVADAPESEVREEVIDTEKKKHGGCLCRC